MNESSSQTLASSPWPFFILYNTLLGGLFKINNIFFGFLLPLQFVADAAASSYLLASPHLYSGIIIISVVICLRSISLISSLGELDDSHL